jgi:hypothetical protein
VDRAATHSPFSPVTKKKSSVKTFVPLRAIALATIVAATCAPALSAPSPAPAAAAHPTATLPPPPLPTTAVHTEFVVEVNKLGQVVRIKSGVPSKSGSFNTQTEGNALQMWIRRPNGTADVGLFKVTFDFDPKTREVSRHISVVSLGGTWGDEPGAATKMIDDAKREAAEADAKQKQAAASLPGLHDITGTTPSPSPTPKPLPF